MSVACQSRVNQVTIIYQPMHWSIYRSRYPNRYMIQKALLGGCSGHLQQTTFNLPLHTDPAPHQHPPPPPGKKQQQQPGWKIILREEGSKQSQPTSADQCAFPPKPKQVLEKIHPLRYTGDFQRVADLQAWMG